MKIVIRNDNNAAICYGETVTFTHCLVEPVIALDLTEDNTTVVDVVTVPEFFVSGLFRYENGEFVISDTSLYGQALKNEYLPVITNKVQSRLDSFAKTRNYDSILSACTYATSTIQQFANEGQLCVNLRDATWGKLYQIMQEVEDGVRPMPTGFADIEGELPELSWGTL